MKASKMKMRCGQAKCFVKLKALISLWIVHVWEQGVQPWPRSCARDACDRVLQFSEISHASVGRPMDADGRMR